MSPDPIFECDDTPKAQAAPAVPESVTAPVTVLSIVEFSNKYSEWSRTKTFPSYAVFVFEEFPHGLRLRRGGL